MNNCDVLLVNPAFGARFNGAPMNLVALATFLRRHGVDAQTLDLCIESEPQPTFESALHRLSPRIIALGSYSPTHLAAIDLARTVRSALPEALIVKGGIHETLVPHETLTRHCEIDVVIEGPGEVPLLQMFESAKGRLGLGDIPGISFRNSNGEILRNTRSRSLPGPTLDSLPIPDRRLLKRSSYYDFNIFGGKRTAQVITTRGCPYSCTFCPASASNKDIDPYRWRTIQSIMDEIECIKQQGFDAIFFDDSVFTLNEGRTYKICEEMYGSQLEWACQTRVDCVSPRLLASMKNAGCSYIFFGLESGDEGQLQLMRKDLNPDQSWKALREAIDAGLTVGVSLIVGYPGESESKVVELLTRLSTFDQRFLAVSLSMFALYPGTTEWARAKASGIVQTDSYESAHAQDSIWDRFDEGRGAIHVVDVDYAWRMQQLAENILGEKALFSELPR
ncbi:MAG: radical SAM protein [Alphaproteobacteria bacterium]